MSGNLPPPLQIDLVLAYHTYLFRMGKCQHSTFITHRLAMASTWQKMISIGCMFRATCYCCDVSIIIEFYVSVHWIDGPSSCPSRSACMQSLTILPSFVPYVCKYWRLCVFCCRGTKMWSFIFRLVKHCIEGHAVHICKGRSSGVLCVAQTITSLYNLSSAHM